MRIKPKIVSEAPSQCLAPQRNLIKRKDFFSGGRLPSTGSQRVGHDLATDVAVVQSLDRVLLFVTPWTVALQAPWSMALPRQECWSGLPFLSPEDLPSPGIQPMSPALTGRFFTSEPPGKPLCLGLSTK